jgi:hypothetical protein
VFSNRSLAAKAKLFVLCSLIISVSSAFARELADLKRLDFVAQNKDGLLVLVFDNGAIHITQHGHNYDIDEVFDHWIFPDSGYKKTNDPRTQRTLLTIALAVQIEQTCKTYHFNEQYKRKLYLSGQGDIERFFDRLERFKAQFRQSIEHAEDITLEERKLAMELRETYRRLPFRQTDSIYSKMLQRALISERISPEPLSLLNARESVKTFDDLKLYELCADLVEQYIAAEAPLRDKQQRIQLAEMLKRELRLTQVLSRDRPELAWRKMAELSESAWKSRLDQAQWETLNKKLQDFREIAETN